MPIRREQRGRVSVLIIDRPERANAIDLDTSQELSTAFDELAADHAVRVVVLTGAGERVFCAGMDLKAVAAGQAREINGVAGGFTGLVRRELPKPIVAAVEGAAMGGGFEIALACDLVVASETARFGLPEVGHGLIAASGGLVRLPRRMPAVLAVEAILTGEPIGADRAMALGLINRVAPAGQALSIALELASTIAERDAGAVQASVSLARSVARGDESDAWRTSAELAASLASAAHNGASQ